MSEFNFALYDGSIYKKLPEAKYTYGHTSTVHNFIHTMMGNREVANEIIDFQHRIIDLLSEKSCRLIEQLVIDFNFIEVLPKGYCFNIEKKTFEKDPPDLKGKVCVLFLVLLQEQIMS